MRVVVVLTLLALCVSRASAQPVRVNVQCEQIGRTMACPAFLLGFIDAQKVLLQSPRVIYANASEVALLDRVHLRFVGSVAGALTLVEIDVDLDSRAADDTQRVQLEPAFLRGMTTKRELPSPDLDAVDPSDYAQLSRLSYAEPLSMYGSFNVKLHWDRSSGARNDRLEEL